MRLRRAWILGIEGAFSAGDISGSTPGYGLSTLTAKTAWIASLTGRVGHSWDNWLAYVKGGAAWADDKYTSSYSPGPWSASETRSGWTVGGGLEWAFANNWSARLEYDYFDFGTSNVTLTGGGNTSNEKVAQKIHSDPRRRQLPLPGRPYARHAIGRTAPPDSLADGRHPPGCRLAFGHMADGPRPVCFRVARPLAPVPNTPRLATMPVDNLELVS